MSHNSQNREKILKVTRKKNQVSYKSRTTRATVDFPVKTLKTRKDWTHALEGMKDYGCQHRLLYPVKLSGLKNRINLHRKVQKQLQNTESKEV